MMPTRSLASRMAALRNVVTTGQEGGWTPMR